MAFVVALVAVQHLILRIGFRQLVRHQQRRGGQAQAVGGVAGQFQEAVGRDAVGLVERQINAQLVVVAGDDGRALPEVEVQDRLHALGAADAGQLRGHVGVLGVVGFVGDDLHAHVTGDLLGDVAAGGAEAAGAGNQADLGDAALFHIHQHAAGRLAVGLRSFEHPLFHRRGDGLGAGQGNERYAGLFDQRYRGHGGAGGGAADNDVHPVLAQQAVGEGARLGGVAHVIVVHQLHLLAEQAAVFVQFVDVEFQGFQFRIAQERSRSGNRKERANTNGIRGQCGGGHQAEAQGGDRAGGQLFQRCFHYHTFTRMPGGELLFSCGHQVPYGPRYEHRYKAIRHASQ